jgi:peptidoglycan hydrolase-like protein with peptidoglycan-binding domain
MAEPVLKKGSNDPAVRDLQAALKALGHDPGPIDGVFGPTTEAAVKAFQQEREIAADGVVGKVTWINIDEADQSEPTLTLGATGLPVRRAQKRMSLVGYQVGGVDGRYGSKTEAAVKQLQQQHAITADGVVGAQTWDGGFFLRPQQGRAGNAEHEPDRLLQHIRLDQLAPDL